MLLYPAIDVQGGGLARTDRGGDPLALARALAGAGVAWVHVVDLDRVRASGRNDDIIRAVVGALPGVRVQLGGGLDQPDDVGRAFDWGVSRVVLGAGAVERLGGLIDRFGAARLAVGLNAGLDAAERVVDVVVGSGITTIIHRNHDRDGTLTGADLESAGRLLGRGADIVLAGGVASLDELRRARDAGFAGAIVGRALLAGRFTLAEAMACCG
jgi:phosphoribosylformimino-5-aminoimidazole carboxamide ribotide isomerase